MKRSHTVSVLLPAILLSTAGIAHAQDPMPAAEGLEGAFPTVEHFSPYAAACRWTPARSGPG